MTWAGGKTNLDHPLVALCRLEPDGADLRPVLRRAAELCCAGVSGLDAVSVVLGPPDGPELVVASSALGQAADGAQLNAGAGPTFEAYARRAPTCAPDAWSDPRWPALARWPVHPPVHGVVAVPLVPAGGNGHEAALGVLTGYQTAEPPDAGPAPSRVAPYAARVEALVRHGRELAAVTEERDQLKVALTSRSAIDQAKGLVMALRGGDADTAFEVLKLLSNKSNRKVRVVSQELVEVATAGHLAELRRLVGQPPPRVPPRPPAHPPRTRRGGR